MTDRDNNTKPCWNDPPPLSQIHRSNSVPRRLTISHPSIHHPLSHGHYQSHHSSLLSSGSTAAIFYQPKRDYTQELDSILIQLNQCADRLGLKDTGAFKRLFDLIRNGDLKESTITVDGLLQLARLITSGSVHNNPYLIRQQLQSVVMLQFSDQSTQEAISAYVQTLDTLLELATSTLTGVNGMRHL
ncbi:hypothetical protein ACOME3_007320 [Neoechinorhynchus agilis]